MSTSIIKVRVRWILPIVIFIASLASLAIYYNLTYKPEHTVSPTVTSGVEVKPKALIADGLYEDYPNPELLEFLKKILENHGYQVDVIKGENVSLDVFRKLTSYNLIILRLHGGYAEVQTAEGSNVSFIGLFTGMYWEEGKYDELKERLLVTKGTPLLNPEVKFVAALPKFFKEEVKGRFPTYSVIVVASCYGLAKVDIAYALFQKGLKYYIGWGGRVTVAHMDESVKLLFKLVFEDNLSWPKAVERVNEILGADPESGSKMHIAIPYRE